MGFYKPEKFLLRTLPIAWMILKVMRKPWTGTRVIRRQIPLSKPKWEITKITNRQNAMRTNGEPRGQLFPKKAKHGQFLHSAVWFIMKQITLHLDIEISEITGWGLLMEFFLACTKTIVGFLLLWFINSACFSTPRRSKENQNSTINQKLVQS